MVSPARWTDAPHVDQRDSAEIAGIASITRPPFGRHRLEKVQRGRGKPPAMNPFVLIPQHIARLALRASWPFAWFKHWPRVKRRAVPATAPYGRFSALRALVLPQARQEAAGSQRASMRSSAAAPRRDSPCRFPFHAFSCASSLSASLSCGRSIAFAWQSAGSGDRPQPAWRQVLIITQRTRARSPAGGAIATAGEALSRPTIQTASRSNGYIQLSTTVTA
jgi:hypothetical protein